MCLFFRIILKICFQNYYCYYLKLLRLLLNTQNRPKQENIHFLPKGPNKSCTKAKGPHSGLCLLLFVILYHALYLFLLIFNIVSCCFLFLLFYFFCYKLNLVKKKSCQKSKAMVLVPPCCSVTDSL